MQPFSIFQFLTILGVMVSGIWALWIFIDRKMTENAEKMTKSIEENRNNTSEQIKRVYERIDEERKTYYENFVLNAVYKSDKDHDKNQRQLIQDFQEKQSDEKFRSMFSTFTLQLTALTNKVEDFIKDYRQNRQEDNENRRG